MSKIPTLPFETPIIEIENKIEELKKMDLLNEPASQTLLLNLEKRLEKTKVDVYKKLTPTQKIMVARHPNRPYTLDYINGIFDNFEELHGDRLFGDDMAIVGGIAEFHGEPVVVLGHQKGRNTKENISRNFGMAHPEGYRKAIRLFKLAQSFNRPIITFVDTAGAFPGLGAEERGQAEAIAKAQFEMAKLTVPMVSVVIGEGGSGGALGIAMGNRVLMLEFATYSVISPEGCASILWNDLSYSDKAAEALKLTAQDLLGLNVIDEIINEPSGGAHRNYGEIISSVGEALKNNIDELKLLSPQELLENRYNKYRNMGIFGIA